MNHNMKLVGFCLICFAIGLSGSVALGQSNVIYVNASNTSGIENGTPAYPYNTINEGIAAARSGGTIQVAAGTYGNAYIYNRQNLTVTGAGTGSVITGAYEKIRIEGCSGITIQGFCIQGGQRGIIIQNSTGICVQNNTIRNITQYSYSSGGAFEAGSSGITLANNIIQSCYGGQYGGIGYFYDCSLYVLNNYFLTNTAWNSGGGLYVVNNSGKPTRISGNYFLANKADYSGAIDVSGPGLYLTEIDHNLIVGSGAGYGWAGAIKIRYSAGAVTSAVRVVNNVVKDVYVACCGSPRIGIYVTTGIVYAVNNIYTSSYGFAVYAERGARVTVGYSDIIGMTCSNVIYDPGNISTNPMFVNAGAGDYRLQPASRCVNAGNPAPQYNDSDGSRNNMGAFGGPLNTSSNGAYAELPDAYKRKLADYAAATVRYFTSTQANNTLVGFTHAFYGTGKYHYQSGTTWFEANMARGYGSHMNINETTLRFLSLATAYKMSWLTNMNASLSYTNTWRQILTGLQTLRSMQTSGNASQFLSNSFHRVYLTTIYRSGPDKDRTATEIVRDPAVNKQSSDDNALPWMNLLLLEGLARDTSVNIADRTTITNLCRQIRDGINLRRFVVSNKIVHEYNNGVPSTLYWDRLSTEGPMILSAMLLSRQITTTQFYQVAASMKNYPVNWNTVPSGTIRVDKPSYHSALFMHGLRAIHGMPVTPGEFSTNVNFFGTSVRPILEAHVDYALYNGYSALGSQVMSQPLWGTPLFEINGIQGQFPGNESNKMPVFGASLARGTGPHAWFVPLQRWKSLSSYDIDSIFQWAAQYEGQFLKAGPDYQNQLGWEAAIPWKPTDTTYAWYASNGTWQYTDWGRPFEALNTAYTTLSIFDALNPTNPLSSYSPEKTRLGYLAAYFDRGTPLPASLFP